MTECLDIRGSLVQPYWATGETESLPGFDFNREIVPPGTNVDFPEGCLGIRADGDFWAVAALPLSYEAVPLETLVKALWPTIADRAECTPDSGTIEQKLYFFEQENVSLRRSQDHMNKVVKALEDEVARLRASRPKLTIYPTVKRAAESLWLHHEYTNLLYACAHEHRPQPAAPGLCECGLDASDRVHMRHYQNKRDKIARLSLPFVRAERREDAKSGTGDAADPDLKLPWHQDL